jgi:AcrR family transcriptional regulator
MRPPTPEGSLRHVPVQARSRERLRRVLDAADQVLAREGVAAFTTNRIAAVAGVPVGSVYHYFPDKAAVIEALAVAYWSDLADLVAAAAEEEERSPLADPAGNVIETLAAGFRARRGFMALWYGGLRTEAVRNATRPIRTSVGASVERLLAVHWPRADAAQRVTVARMLVITGDGLLREAFRHSPEGDPVLLAESRAMLDAYAVRRLGERAR